MFLSGCDDFKYLFPCCSEKRTLSVFWLNAAETWVDIRSNVADKVSATFLVGLKAWHVECHNNGMIVTVAR